MTIVEPVGCADHPKTLFGLHLPTGRVYLTGWTASRLRREVAAVRLGGSPCRCAAAVVAWQDGTVARLPDTLGDFRRLAQSPAARLVRRLAARRPAPAPIHVLGHGKASVDAAVIAEQLVARGLAVRRAGAGLTVAVRDQEVSLAVTSANSSIGFTVSVTPIARSRSTRTVRYTPAFCRSLSPAQRTAVVLDVVETAAREEAAAAEAAVAVRRAFRQTQTRVLAGTDSGGGAIDCDQDQDGVSLAFRVTHPLPPAVARYAAKKLAALGNLLVAYQGRPRG